MGGYRKSTVNPGGEIVCGVKSESSPLVTVSGDLDGLLFLYSEGNTLTKEDFPYKC